MLFFIIDSRRMGMYDNPFHPYQFSYKRKDNCILCSISMNMDEFILVFQDIEYGDFKMLLNRISDHVQNIFVDDDVQLSVSIGGMYNINNIDEALAYADKLMYQGKKKHKKLL